MLRNCAVNAEYHRLRLARQISNPQWTNLSFNANLGNIYDVRHVPSFIKLQLCDARQLCSIPICTHTLLNEPLYITGYLPATDTRSDFVNIYSLQNNKQEAAKAAVGESNIYRKPCGTGA